MELKVYHIQWRDKIPIKKMERSAEANSCVNMPGRSRNTQAPDSKSPRQVLNSLALCAITYNILKSTLRTFP